MTFYQFRQLLMEPYGEAYFICQAINRYLLPDWKLHVSVVKEDYQKTFFAITQFKISPFKPLILDKRKPYKG